MTNDQRPAVSPGWETFCEQTDYRRTPNFAETIEYARRLAESSALINFETFGRSGEGRELPLLLAAADKSFTPESARSTGKAVVLIQACIHAGEPDGKDAGLALFRDIGVSKALAELLQNVVVLFIPIYNADGHERASRFNRINQNGPEDMGWRATTTNQNLNRDYMKADTPETRAWLALWNKWSPDLFIDCHVTDGADYRYNLTYQFEHHAGVAPSILKWERAVVDRKVRPATEDAGNVLSWYLEFIDNRDLKLGIRDFNGSPRFSTGYVPLRNRPAILIETHMLKDYRSRVIGTYDFLRSTLAEVNRDPSALLNAIRDADADPLAAIDDAAARGRYPLNYALTESGRPYQLKAVTSQTEFSDVSGAERVIFGNDPLDLTVPMYDDFRVTSSIIPPVSYIVPPQWKEVIDVLRFHGLKLQETLKPYDLDIEGYRFHDVRWAPAPFEGRFLTSFETEMLIERRTFPAGSVLVNLDQPAAKVAINLLEPTAPDSLVVWGFFSAIFEQKEYGENYVVEKLAREMLADDDQLDKEFHELLSHDVDFRSSPQRRLAFFYQRSPYWDPRMNVYPVGRITHQKQLEVRNI